MNKLYTILLSSAKWLLISSHDPSRFSATIKGLVPLLSFLGLGYFTDAQVDVFSQDLSSVILGVGSIITSVITIFGLLRKFYYSFKNPSGDNK